MISCINSVESSNMKITYIPPMRIIKEYNASNSQVLLSSVTKHPSFTKDNACVIKKGGYILLDFGCEIAGGIEVTTQYDLSINSSKLRIVFGESVSEALSTLGEKNSGNYHSVRDTIIDVVPYSQFNFGSTGFRFVKIEAMDSDVGIRTLNARMVARDAKLLGSFECDDEMLNKVWQTAVYTVYLNMQEYLYDGIKRDRLVWAGDMYPEVKTILCAFGDNGVIKKTLDYAKNECNESLWMNKIPSYTLWWIKIHRDLYYYSGDIKYLKEQEIFIEKVFEKVKSCISDSGEVSFDRYFTDWSTEGTEDIYLSFRSCLMMGICAIEDVFTVLKNEKAKECNELKNRVKKIIPECYGSKQAAGMSAFSGLCDPKKVNDEILSIDPLKGLSAFYGYFVLMARAMADDTEGSLDLIRNYWGKMIEFGATTFWEDFDVEWTENASPITEVIPEGKKDIHGDFGRFCYVGFRHSLCHGWSSGPAPFMTEYILGIKIIEPGCKEIKIQPNLGGLSYAKGTVPTPYGEIKVSHKIVDGKIITEVSAPDEIKVIM
ncbi:MAG: alpha-L-rhamnosidase [Ruminococcaceae bacterium]|nr:alpha-L-rhamnosidase [Oscillospiraceae bacterium]